MRNKLKKRFNLILFFVLFVIIPFWILHTMNDRSFRIREFDNELKRIQIDCVKDHIESDFVIKSNLSCDGKVYIKRKKEDGGIVFFFPDKIDNNGWASGYLFDDKKLVFSNGDNLELFLFINNKKRRFLLNYIKVVALNWYYLETFS